MPSYRRPKGTIVRSIPDWNANQLAYQNNVFLSGDVNRTVTTLLYNNSNTGSTLILWALDIVTFPQPSLVYNNFPAQGGMMNGFGAASGPFPGAMMNPLSAVINGQIYVLDTDVGDAGLTDNLRSFGVSYSGYTWPHDWPCAIIPAGWSFGVNLYGPAQQMSVGFIWEEAPAV